MMPSPIASPTASTSSPPDLAAMPRRARLRQALTSLRTVVADPERTDEVLTFSLYLNAGTARRRVDRFYAEATADQLYREHRSIDSHAIDLGALAALPAGTLGHEYARFLSSRGLTPDVFQAPPEVADPRAAYVAQRFRQTHDLWHVITGVGTDPASEIALQAFLFAQTGAPSAGVLATLGTVRAGLGGVRIGAAARRAYRAGRAARYLGAFPWEDHWATPLGELRRMLGIEPVQIS